MKINFIVLLFALVFLSIPASTSGQTKDVITADKLNISYGTYSAFDQLQLESGAIYAGRVKKEKEKDNSYFTIKYDDNNKNEVGIIMTSSQKIPTGIQIDWANKNNNDAILIFNKEGAFKSLEELYKRNESSTIEIKSGDHNIHKIQTNNKHLGIRVKKSNHYICEIKSITIFWGKAPQNIKFEKENYDVCFGDNFVSPKVQNAQSAVTYSSSKPEVATIDALTGEVKIVGIGTTTITAKTEETETYSETSTQYVLNVQEVSYNARFEFNHPETLQPAYHIGEAVNNDKTFLQEDATLNIQDGTSASVFRKDKNYQCLLDLHSNTIVSINLPTGFIIDGLTLYHYSETGGMEKKIDGNKASYTIKKGRTIHAEYVDVTYSGTYKININSFGYATFSAKRPYVMPAGLEGGIVTINKANRTATIDYIIQPGDTVAAEEPLLLHGRQGEYTLIPCKTKVKKKAINNLRPAFTNDEIQASPQEKLFVFSKGKAGLGFYFQKGCADGSKVSRLANKAYLPVDADIAAKGLSIVGLEPTGIDSMASEEEKDFIYTLSGIPVNIPKEDLPRGFYIINGKKIIIK